VQGLGLVTKKKDVRTFIKHLTSLDSASPQFFPPVTLQVQPGVIFFKFYKLREAHIVIRIDKLQERNEIFKAMRVQKGKKGPALANKVPLYNKGRKHGSPQEW
jgi:hypothetical protein